MAYEYKCVSGPTIVAVKNTKVRDQAVKAFEDIMNVEAAQGWEFVGIDEFHVSEPQGLLSRKRVYVPAKILVFRREKASSILSDALKARLVRPETAVVNEPQKMASEVSSMDSADNHEALQTQRTSTGQTVTALIEKIKSKQS